MRKAYKVSLYDGVLENDKREFRKVQDIIVIRTPFSISEILTGYQLGIAYSADPVPHQVYIRENQIREYGHQPMVNLQEFVNKNLATPQELDEYIDAYETSEWKNIYEEMKLLTTAQKKELQAKVKQVFKSKA